MNTVNVSIYSTVTLRMHVEVENEVGVVRRNMPVLGS